MHLYVLIQTVFPPINNDCGISHWLGPNYIEILEQYQFPNCRISLVRAVGIWGPEAKLEAWRSIHLSNLIAWERVS